MKRSLILLTLCSCFFSVSAQQKDLTYFNYKGDDIAGFLTKRVRYPSVVIDAGAMPFTYVKFKINDKNEVDSINVTNKNYPDIEKELRKELKLTHGYWNLQATGDKWFTLAVDFSMSYISSQKGIYYRKIMEDKIAQQAIRFSAKPSVLLPTIYVIGYSYNKREE